MSHSGYCSDIDRNSRSEGNNIRWFGGDYSSTCYTVKHGYNVYTIIAYNLNELDVSLSMFSGVKQEISMLQNDVKANFDWT